VIWKESTAETRKRIEEDLKRSAEKYADHAEDKISKLQEAYLRKNRPQKYAYSANNISQRPPSRETPNRRFGGKVSTFSLFRGLREDFREPEPASAKPTLFEEGIANISESPKSLFT
jgi:hypothetical protein